MFKTTLATMLTGLAIGVVAAPDQAQVGSIGDLAGSVTVSRNGLVSKAVYGTVLYEGSTIMVASDGRAKVKLVNNCDVSLRGSQYITVNSKLLCQDWQASVQHLLTSYRVSQMGGTVQPGAAGGEFAGVASPLLGFGIVAGVATADRLANEEGTSGR